MKYIDFSRSEEYKSELEYIGGAFFKRLAFDHEAETRVVILANEEKSNINTTQNKRFLSMDVDLNDLVDKIILDPRTTESDEMKIRRIINSKMKRVAVEKSLLYGKIDNPLNLKINTSW